MGDWNLPVNADFSAIDSLFGNNGTISLSNANVTLTTPPNSGAAWAGPYQSQSALITMTGTLTAPVAVIFPRAGFFIVQNNTVGFYVALQSSGGGNQIGAVPGKKCHVFNDGTNMDYVNMPDPGTAYDLHGATSIPLWMQACTVQPYLLKNGAVYNNSQYPALAAVLGNAFGGTPGLTFAVPDEMARVRAGLDTVGTNRLTAATSGITGTTMGSAGGQQQPQGHTHGATTTISPNPHAHTIPATFGTVIVSGSAQFFFNSGTPGFNTGSTSLSAGTTIATQFTGTSGNVQPTIVSILPLLKT